MNGKESFWTVHVAAGWAVKRQGSRELIAVHERQRDAWAEARRLAGGKVESNGPDQGALVFHGRAA